MADIYKELSAERKLLQEQGELPEWFTTAGWQMFKKIRFGEETYKQACDRISRTLSQWTPDKQVEMWRKEFFDLLWSGMLAPSTPVLGNTGTGSGCSVSCSGQYIGDSVDEFYSNLRETAILSKNGFGTSGYFGDIRARGSDTSKGFKTSGSLPVFKSYVQCAKDISQGSKRRGSFAGYLPIDHGDFYEWLSYVHKTPDDVNIGWIIPDSFIKRLENQDEDAISRFQKALKIKCETGKGYFLFIDKVNKQNPQCYKDRDLKVKASNLCNEVMLTSDTQNTYTCVLSSLNLIHWPKIKETKAVRKAIMFLHCVAEDFIQNAKHIPGLEKAVEFTRKSYALGLGAMGLHTYLQMNNIAFEEFAAHTVNQEIFSTMQKEAKEMSAYIATLIGEPEWCKGSGYAHTHLLAIAPNMSSAIVAGGVSQGIEPVIANVFSQESAAGELERINPVLLKIMKERGKNTRKEIEAIAFNLGSVKDVDWLDEHEKLVFKTGYEIDQRAILRLASTRQQYIDQGQSLNLFFAADESEEYIAQIHKEAFLDQRIKGLYYMRTLAGVSASKDECLACQ